MARRKKNVASPLQNASAQTQAALFKIPPELRNRIYEEIFDGRKPCSPREAAPGLLVTCKLFYAEALQIYYNNNAFRFTALSTLQGWLSKLSSASVRSLQRIEFAPYSPRIKIKGFDTCRTDKDIMHLLLSRLDHMLQAKGANMDCGAIRVNYLAWWWTWKFDEDGKKVAVKHKPSLHVEIIH